MADETGQLKPPSTPKAGNPVEEAAKTYQALRTKITEGYEKARKEGKNFYVVMGESHTSSRSLLVEIMAADIVRRLDPDRKDVGRLILERSPKQLDEALQGKLLDSNFAVMASLGKQTLKLPSVSMDEEPSEALQKAFDAGSSGDKKAQAEYAKMVSESMPRRDKLFADTIAAQPGGVVITGVMHGKGVLTNLKTHKEASVLPLNVTSVTPSADKKLHPLLEYALDKNNMEQVALKDVPDNMDVPTTIRLAQMAIGAANAPALPAQKQR